MRIGYMVPTTAINAEIVIDAYDNETIYTDLVYVIFKQNYSMQPWIDTKYQKRIARTLLFGLLNAKTNDVRLGNNNNFTIYQELIECADRVLDALTNNNPLPFNEFTKFIVNIPGNVYTPQDHQFCQRIINEIQYNLTKNSALTHITIIDKYR
jgi:hypothetical protein